MRLDQYLVQSGLAESRAKAREAVEAGLVAVNGAAAKKVSQKIADTDEVAVSGEVHPFVSRGGVKLDVALRRMEIDAEGKTCLDLGASTGGFTDVLLRAGAAKVYAVDVGRGQLHEKIAGDPRVVNLEQTHAKDLSSALIPDPVEVIVCDVSFISLKKALPFALALAAPGARLAALVKPQFEVGPEGIGKGGLVKEGLAGPVADDMAQWIEARGWRLLGLIDSPIKGGDGNKEFLIGAAKTA
ncbi:TlyA family RNA methyltransferase [Hyphococcus luteus]|uniref:TlyA family rRNA (Cytidine-2'-O)-methyltransferase n=1 Tax=Hyphococcus luteus TaxID=2058213 RepID=A0A2S7K3H0_9PROT|nr:TlyA family RNA methyltransferase [Marinicaulis flavus]PQA87052.1 TlyA family rRNA (cytidine-2'-O)-methyltransferase [Marinicaulis flavus]